MGRVERVETLRAPLKGGQPDSLEILERLDTLHILEKVAVTISSGRYLGLLLQGSSQVHFQDYLASE